MSTVYKKIANEKKSTALMDFFFCCKLNRVIGFCVRRKTAGSRELGSGSDVLSIKCLMEIETSDNQTSDIRL